MFDVFFDTNHDYGLDKSDVIRGSFCFANRMRTCASCGPFIPFSTTKRALSSESLGTSPAIKKANPFFVDLKSIAQDRILSCLDIVLRGMQLHASAAKVGVLVYLRLSLGRVVASLHA